MPRILSDSLMSKLLTGEFKEILEFVKNDSELSFQIRTGSVAIIYYRKRKILSLYSIREPKLLDSKYCGKMQLPFLDINNPYPYFVNCKKYVDKYFKFKKNIEFDIQQKVEADNKSLDNPFIVVDMEYQFEQKLVDNRTKTKTRFDLVTIEQLKNKIVLLELKQVFSSSAGKAGVNDHKSRYDEHIRHPLFSKSLVEDIKTMISQKIELGIIDVSVWDILSRISKDEIDMTIIFAYKTLEEKTKYEEKYLNDNEILFLDITKGKYRIEYDV